MTERKDATTPGPWEVASSSPGDYYVRSSKTGKAVARCLQAVSKEANANLISKAWLIPEMAEALQKLMGILGGIPAGRNYQDQIQQARAVLAKYESEEP